MLKEYVLTEEGRRRHLLTPVGPHLDGYSGHLKKRGFAFATIQTDLQFATVLGEYLLKRDMPIDKKLPLSILEDCIGWYQVTPRRSGFKRRVAGGSRSMTESLKGSLRKLLGYLQAIDVISKPAKPAPCGHYGDALSAYMDFLDRHRGFRELTLDQHRRWVVAFLEDLATRVSGKPLRCLLSEDVEDFVEQTLPRVGKRSGMIMRCVLEAFVDFLKNNEMAPTECRPFLPRKKTYRLASLPRVPNREQVQSILEGIDRCSPMGRRDYAAVLLVATYGLRANEVVSLRLEDILWRQQIIHVRQTKTRRELRLPLTPEIIDALVNYLRDGRPKTFYRELFIKCHAPIEPLTRATLYCITKKAIKQSGIEVTHFGPHSLRHAFATKMIRAGFSLKEVGDLMGHRDPTATLLYCKLAVEDLREVALEIPGGLS